MYQKKFKHILNCHLSYAFTCGLINALLVHVCSKLHNICFLFCYGWSLANKLCSVITTKIQYGLSRWLLLATWCYLASYTYNTSWCYHPIFFIHHSYIQPHVLSTCTSITNRKDRGRGTCYLSKCSQGTSSSSKTNAKANESHTYQSRCNWEHCEKLINIFWW